jgi:MFS family permease
MSNTDQANSASRPYPSVGYACYVVFVLFLAYTVSSIDRQILTLMIDPVRADLELTDVEISLLQGFAFSILFSVVGLPVSRLADRKNRRNIVAIGISFWCVMTAMCGYAQNFVQLFLARMGVGVGEATLTPTATSMISDYFEPRSRGMALSIFYLGYPIGGGAALLIGAFVLSSLEGMETVSLSFLGIFKPWQAAFLIVGLPGLLLAALMFTVKEPLRRGMLKVKGQEVIEKVPLGQVGAYIKQNGKAYSAHISGVTLASVLSFGVAMWFPTFFMRTYGLTAGEAGYYYGTIVIVSGTMGLIIGGWLSRCLRDRGYIDANFRVMMIAVLGKSGYIIAPLMPTAELALLVLFPTNLFSSMLPGVNMAALHDITPNQMRGQMTAIMLFFVNMVGMSFGGILIAVFTDYIFQDVLALRYSLSCAAALVIPVVAYILYSGMDAFRESLRKYGPID